MKCIGQVLLDVIHRCNETSSICDKLRIDTHDVKFEKSGGITVTFKGHLVQDETQRFRLGVSFQPVMENYVPEDVLYHEVVRELTVLREGLA